MTFLSREAVKAYQRAVRMAKRMTKSEKQAMKKKQKPPPREKDPSVPY